MALLREGVDQYRAAAGGHHLLRVLEGLQHNVHAVPLNRTHVAEIQGFEEQAGGEENLQRLLGLPGPMQHVTGQAAQKLLRPTLHAPHHGGGELSREIGRHRPDIGGNRHGVVVEHDDEIALLKMPRVVERFEGHPRRHGAIANQRDHQAILTAVKLRPGHTQGGGDGCARVTRSEMIVLGFASPEKFGNAPALPDAIELDPPAREHLVGVALVSHVENQAVPRRIEDVVDGGDEFHRAQAGCQVPPGLGDLFENLAANLVRYLLDLVLGQGAQVRGRFDAMKQASFTHTSLRTAKRARARKGSALSPAPSRLASTSSSKASARARAGPTPSSATREQPSSSSASRQSSAI